MPIANMTGLPLATRPTRQLLTDLAECIANEHIDQHLKLAWLSARIAEAIAACDGNWSEADQRQTTCIRLEALMERQIIAARKGGVRFVKPIIIGGDATDETSAEEIEAATYRTMFSGGPVVYTEKGE